MRNSTIWLIPVISVSPPTMRNVPRTDTPPTSRGSSARNEPKTSARITSAPSDPIIVSTMIPVPLDAGAPLASRSSPVSPKCQPGGSAASAARVIAAAGVGPPNEVDGGVNTSANVVRPSLVRNARSPVEL